MAMLRDLNETIKIIKEGLNRKGVPFSTYFTVLPYLKPHWIMCVATILGVVVVSLLAIPSPIILGRIVDKVIPKGDYNELLEFVLLLLFVQVVICIISFFLNYYSTVLSQNILMTIKKTFLGKVLKLPCSFFDGSQTGYLVSRINEVNMLGPLFSTAIIKVFINFVEVFFCIVFMLFISWKLTLLALLIIPIMVLVTGVGVAGNQAASDRMLERSALLAMNMQESLSGVEIVKILGREQEELDKLYVRIKAATEANVSQSVILSFFAELSVLIGVSAGFLILFVSGQEIIGGSLTLGMYLAFSGFSGKVFANINMNISMWMSMRMVGVAIQRINSIESVISEEEDLNRNIVIRKIEGNIEFKSVSFSYFEGYPVYENLSFEIKKGSKVLVCGESGSGKSTLFKLILGMYKLKAGQILIDGVDINNINLSSLRDKVSVVTQNIFLFNDTILNNILLGNPKATKQDAINAAILSGANDFICKLENGYDTVVGERGTRLSGGQTQRISIARAIVRKSEVYLFDEATSYLDAQNTIFIEDAIKKVVSDKTCLVISHKVEPSWLSFFDEVITLKEGRIFLETRSA